MKKLVASTFLALSLIGAGAASAATISETSALVFNTGGTNSSFNKSFNDTDIGKNFIEKYTFSVGKVFDVSSAVISIALNNVSLLKLTSFTLTGNGQTITGVKSVVGATQFFQLDASHLSAGSYILAVNGKVLGSGGGYGGTLNIAAVPEASTTAMMLGGLALVGFAAVRRRRKDGAKQIQGSMALA